MKALTIHQPWAWAIAQGYKTIENRNWVTSYRGPLLIHAGRSRKSIESGRRFLGRLGIEMPDADQLAFGAIMAITRLKHCLELEAVIENPFAEGPICWVLEDVHAIEPLPWPGEQGLFNVADEAVKKLRLVGSRAVGVEPPYPSWWPGTLPLS